MRLRQDKRYQRQQQAIERQEKHNRLSKDEKIRKAKNRRGKSLRELAKLMAMLFLILCVPQWGYALERYVIPHVIQGAQVYIQNVSGNLIAIELNDDENVEFMLPNEIKKFTADKRGRIIIDSTDAVLAWSIVDGVTFTATKPAQSVKFLVTPLTGLAITSDISSELEITFSVYDGTRLVDTLTGNLLGGATLVIWASDLLLNIRGPEYTFIAKSPTPNLIIGAARFHNNRYENVPVWSK